MKLSAQSLAVTAAVALFALAGCSGGSSDASDSVTVTEIPVDEVVPADVFDSGFVNAGDSLKIVLGGSGSCPPEIESGKIDGDKATLTLVELPENQACTADFVLYGFDVNFGVSVSDVKTVEVVNSLGSTELSEIEQ